MKTIDYTDIMVGQRIRVTRSRDVKPGSLLVKDQQIFEGTILKARPERLTFAESFYDGAILEDNHDVFVINDGSDRTWTFEVLDYAVDTIVRAIVLRPDDDAAKEGPLDEREFEPFLCIRLSYGWATIGEVHPSRPVRYGALMDSDIESGQQRFDIVEIVYSAKATS
jgi:hypothetical protein